MLSTIEKCVHNCIYLIKKPTKCHKLIEKEATKLCFNVDKINKITRLLGEINGDYCSSIFLMLDFATIVLFDFVSP